jgi:hypothetical protein
VALAAPPEVPAVAVGCDAPADVGVLPVVPAGTGVEAVARLGVAVGVSAAAELGLASELAVPLTLSVGVGWGRETEVAVAVGCGRGTLTNETLEVVGVG